MGFRRIHIPGATVFITQVVRDRQPWLVGADTLGLLHETFRIAQTLYSFNLIAHVVLPDHFHMLIELTGASTFSQIMHSIKPNFTKAYKALRGIEGSLSFWQPRFWDHIIRNETDFQNHLEYIRWNPVKHGYVQRPEDWPGSSFASPPQG